MTTYTSEELREIADFVEAATSDVSGNITTASSVDALCKAANILYQLAEAKPRAWEIYTPPLDRVCFALPEDPIPPEYKTVKWPLYKLPIKESNDKP